MTAVRVIKVGGAALSDGAWLDALAFALSASPAPAVLVHGGGPEISALAAQLGIGVSWNGGRRVTSPEALDVASMVLNGRVNKRIVSALVGAGVDAVGLSGEDGALLRARTVQDGALGRVGAIEAVRCELLEWLLARGIVPVVSPISRGEDGGALNVNADEAAAAIAAALSASELLFLTDVPGVRVDGQPVAELDAEAAAGLIATAQAFGGMGLKLEAALDALARGVGAIRIGDFAVLSRSDAGTRIRRRNEVLVCS